MLMRYKSTKEEFYSNRFNHTAMNEVLTGDDSVFFHEVEVFIDGKWIDFNVALGEKLVIPDNYNVRFRQPWNEKEKERGWYG